MANLGVNILDVMYGLIGLICLYAAIKSLKQENKAKAVGTFVFWLCAGIAVGLGKWIELYGGKWFPNKTYNVGDILVGVVVVIMILPSVFNRLGASKNKEITQEERQKRADKIGYKIFIPTLLIGFSALCFALFLPTVGALAGLGVGVLLSALVLLLMSRDKPQEVLINGKRLMDSVGDLSMLPQLLASLGAVFTLAGVGTAVAKLVGYVVPKGNVDLGIVVYALGMVVFTMIMGNAFAAFAVMTVGIGIPFVLSYGYNPNLIGMLALTSGYCGTLLTPMAANFNILPVAVLDMNNKYTVIKKQAPVALIMLVIQIAIMIIFK